MVYLQLFLSFLKVGFIGFGGGMAIISLIKEDVLRYGWVTEQEFVDIVAISQVTPGPIGMNCATYIGYTAGGIAGSVLASLGIILPSLLIMLIICRLYDRIHDKWQDNQVFVWVMRVIRLLVVFLIAHAAITLMSPATFPDGWSWVLFGVVFVCSVLPVFIHTEQGSVGHRVLDAVSHPIYLILLCGAVGLLSYLIG
ncbi:MAG: chromate transporter [Paludibacteraceae bacterium]|nr:chromate transporter [Paludibacteraceae bacterium]